MPNLPNPRTPVIVGVGQFLNRISSVDDAVEPLEMMMRAVRLAESDTGTGGFLNQLQSIRVVRGMWSYENPAAIIAERLGAANAQTVGTLVGGNQNQALMNHTAAEILAGKYDLVLLTGAENGNSTGKARRTGVRLPQTPAPGTPDAVFGAEQRPEHHEYEVAKGIQRAIQVYPMYDNAVRYQRGETLAEHIERVSGLWSRFNDVAQDNPNAWVRENMTAEEIRTPSARNRQISFPYTKFMNANMSVDMAAALIVCAYETAKRLGIREAKYVYPHSGVEGYDHFSASVRGQFLHVARDSHHRQSGDGLGRRQCRRLGLRGSVQLFPVGGAGGGGGTRPSRRSPGSRSPAASRSAADRSTTMSCIASRARSNCCATSPTAMRWSPPTAAISTSTLTACTRAGRRSTVFRRDDVKAEIAALPSRRCIPEYDGEATVESYTVMYENGEPRIGHVACLTPAGERTWVNTEDPDLAGAMVTEEFCGRSARLRHGEIAITN